MMKRREFITLLGGAAAWPLAARAQQQPMPVIGFLNGGSPELFAPYVDAFLLGLNEAGFAKDRNCAMAYRWARGRYEELPSLAAELVNHKVAVIAASGRTAVMAAKAATSVIPIIFLIGGDPVRLGLVSGLWKPGGNASGVIILTLALDLQRLGLLREALARTASIAVLFNPDCRARCTLCHSSDLRPARFRRGGRFAELRNKSFRIVSPARRLYRTRSQGLGPCRPAGATADQLRAGDQSQNRRGARPHRAAVAARARRRGDRVKKECQREWRPGLHCFIR